MTNIINGRVKAAKFLYRATYGPKGNDIDDLLALGEDAWFDKQFTLTPSLHVPLMRTYAEVSYDGQGVEFSKEKRYSAWLNTAITGDDQLRQRTAFALSQVFVIGPAPKIFPLYSCNYYDLLVKHSFDNVRDILEHITLSPVMGQYLSLNSSAAQDIENNTFPDENFARELMQLFSLGLTQLNNDGTEILDDQGKPIVTYSQQDIEELARVLTGWRPRTWFDPMVNMPRYHDFGEKVVLGETFPAGQTAEQDLSQALDLLFNHKNAAVFLSILLIKRLTISNPTSGYIRRVVKVFRDNGYGVRGDMKAILKAILLDESLINEYADKGNTIGAENRTRHFGKAKEPLIAMTNFCRGLDVQSNDPTRWWDVFMISQGGTGQAPLYAESVFNFYEPDYAPAGEISEKGLSAPEFNLFTMENLLNISNKLWKRIQSWDDTSANGWTWDKTPHDNMIDDHQGYISLLNEVFFGGLMSTRLRDYLTNTLADFTARGKSNDDKIEHCLFVIQCSPEFRCQE